MTSTVARNETVGFNQSGFDQFVDRRIDPVWITQARKDAWAAFESMGWPNPRDENWLRSDLRGFKLARYNPTDETATQSVANAPVRLLEGVDVAGLIRCENGLVTSESLDPKYTAKGVVFGSLSRCVRDHAELVKNIFMPRSILIPIGSQRCRLRCGRTVIFCMCPRT